ncbi:hypothetical protein Q0812_10860 [Brevundimonas sp. 2R-24]|uniref:Secreted protein n=1 Tax=Peiella sedimenti TaxID=3061083 RepID=A0ABT8SPN5_9CAUL|nr:hypothetical protein [Caulobacteraceae bacterium XZ-24]
MKKLALCLALILTPPSLAQATEPAQDAFMERLNSLCGQRFEGRVVSDDPADEGFASQRLLMHVRDCSAEEVRVPFWVGEDRSRTWVITRTDAGLRLKHDHRNPEGRPEGLHWYGGNTETPGTDRRQEFPVDDWSIELFNAWDAQVSTTNVWAMEVEPGEVFAYELRRPGGRFFRVEFDLTRPVAE